MMKIMIKQIIDYAEGRLSEEEAMDLWIAFIINPEDLELLECYLMCKMYFEEG